ncbi:MAG: hypothetical protein E7668_04450 [Ruminococcaceae bacterium]|nr:hypothetical protein [Oscillospiraceae bacterium]
MEFIKQEDREYIENKYHDTKKPFDPYHRRAYHGYEYDHSTGLSDGEIQAELLILSQDYATAPHPVAKAREIEYVLRHTRIDVNEHDYFIGLDTWNRVIKPTTLDKWKNEIFSQALPEIDQTMKSLNASGAVAIWPDFDHVVPDWESLMTLGFPGIRQRAKEYRSMHEAKRPLSAQEKAFFDGIEIEYTAILEFVDRLYRYAKTKSHEKAKRQTECLLHLRDGAPTDSYEAMQLIFLYFMISESVDCYQVRSLGNGLDSTLYPFYQRDLQSGRYTRDEIKELLAYFLLQWSAIGNYWGQPFYLGGTAADGSCLVNDLSHDILDVYRELGLYNPKIQIKYNDNTPLNFLNKVLNMIRCGQSSFVFCCEPGMWQAVMSYGADAEEARTMDIRGCYETGVRANEVSTATGYVNPLKAVVLALHDGIDPRTGMPVGVRTGAPSSFVRFEDFYSAFLKQYGHLIEETIRCANAYDPYMGEINPSSLYSATIKASLERAYDGYGGGVKFNNSALQSCGLGTAVDALMAVYELVYEKQELSLEELVKILDKNWEGHETLRRRALRLSHKYGVNDPLADRYAVAISHFFCDKVNGRKNGRGGVYKAFLHSAMQFVWQGEKTEATPDGRKAGDEISKNASPTSGMDKNGVTALIQSAVKLTPTSYPESFCLDIMLHPSSVAGEEGLSVMKALLDVYTNNGGMSIQMNVFSPEMLKDAQAHPEQYRNLQVRVCGWNVLWNNLSRAEQDAYIVRAENIQ